MIFAPRHFIGVARQIRASDMVVCADFGATQAAKEALGLIGAVVAIGIGDTVIDPLGGVARVQLIPMRSLIGVNRTAFRDMIGNRGDRSIFGLEHFGEGLAVTLA